MKNAVALLLATALFGHAHACDDRWLDITREPAERGVRLTAVNLSGFPLTFTLRARRSAMRDSGPREVTATLAPRESRRLMRIAGGDSGRRPYYCDWTIGSLDAQHDDRQVYVLPYARGRSYRVLQGYGSRFSHTGREQYAIDFKMPEGTPVHAARAGVVARIEEAHDIGCWEDACSRYANYVVVLHDDGTTGEYYHLQQDGALVDAGERVRAGQLIGLSGNTGHSALPHLHFAVYRAVDWGRTQSLPVRILSADGIITRPRRGALYPAVPLDALDDILSRRGSSRATGIGRD